MQWNVDEEGVEKLRDILNVKLNYEDFTREYTDLYQQTFEVPDSITDEIFNSMYKTTSESRNVNCNACGYSSCKKMAKAIALGYNTITNCAKYERDENAKLYTTDRISGLPNRFAFVDELSRRLDKNQLRNYAIIQFNIKNFTIIKIPSPSTLFSPVEKSALQNCL